MSRSNWVALVAVTAAVAGGSVAHAQSPVISLDVTGPASNPGKLDRCQKVAQRSGYVLNPGAPVHVLLILNNGSNRLQINSNRRGEVLNQMRPAWGMEELCRDAVNAAAQALAHENDPPNAPAVAGNYGPPSPQYPPSQYPSTQEPPPGPPPPAYGQPARPGAIALDVVGPMSNPGKRERCMRVAERNGVVIDPNAAVRVTLVLQMGVNRLQITSASRGEVVNQPRPGWGMEQLCDDAIRNAQSVLGAERGGPMSPRPSAAYAPPPPRNPPPAPTAAMTLGPIPPGNDLSPPAKAAADRAVAAWQAARFDAALAAFREAEHLQPDPQFLFDEGVCEQRLGQYRAGIEHAQKFLERAGHSPYRPYGDQLMSELHAALGQ